MLCIRFLFVRCALLSLFPGNPASGTFHNNTDNILISFFVGTVLVGYYSNYAMMIAAVISIISLIFNAVKASIGNLMAGNDCSHREKLFLFNVFPMHIGNFIRYIVIVHSVTFSYRTYFLKMFDKDFSMPYNSS